MTSVIMTLGLPASGKTTWAKAQCALPSLRTVRICKDDVRAMLSGGYSEENEPFVRACRDTLVMQAIAYEYNVIVDDTNLHPKHEERLREVAKVCGVHFFIEDFTAVPLEVCRTRNAARPPETRVPDERIVEMYEKYIQSKESDPV